MRPRMTELLRKRIGINVPYRLRPDTKNPEHLAGVCRAVNPQFWGVRGAILLISHSAACCTSGQ